MAKITIISKDFKKFGGVSLVAQKACQAVGPAPDFSRVVSVCRPIGFRE